MFTTLNKKSVGFSDYNEKFKKYEFFDQQIQVIQDQKREMIQLLNEQMQMVKESYNKYFNHYEKYTNISKMRQEMFQIEEKIENYKNSIEILKKIISQKNSDICISSSSLNDKMRELKSKLQDNKKEYKNIEKYKLMKNAFRKKKLLEVSFCFFNNNFSKIYLIPHFLNQNYEPDNRVVRYQYYERFSKELAVMSGQVACLINYLAKEFNVTMKYPLFNNGSRSFIVKDKKE